MGTITRSFAINITTSGVLLPASLVNNSIANVTAYNASVATGGMKLISSQTASNSTSISFTTGIDSTYKEYQFYYYDINPATDYSFFQFNLSTDAGSNYNVTKTTTHFKAYTSETSAYTSELFYSTSNDLAQSTSYQNITDGIGSGADESGAGYISLYNPASTTYVKHFIGTSNSYRGDDPLSYVNYVAGYGNTTSAVNAVRFQMSTGNFDGTILMFGIV
jgi:hypothetical protein